MQAIFKLYMLPSNPRYWIRHISSYFWLLDWGGGAMAILRRRNFLYFCVMQQPYSSLAASFLRFSRPHTDTLHTVRLLWANDQPVRRSLYLTTHNTHKRQISMSPIEFEPTIPASEWPQSHALDRVAIGIGRNVSFCQ